MDSKFNTQNIKINEQLFLLTGGGVSHTFIYIYIYIYILPLSLFTKTQIFIHTNTWLSIGVYVYIEFYDMVNMISTLLIDFIDTEQKQVDRQKYTSH